MTPPVVTVVGLGLIGGSLAASLRGLGARWRVRAVDRRRSSLDYALRRGFVDEACGSLAEGVRGADLVVLAAPVRAIRELLAELAGLLVPGQVVTDVGSTKVSIVATARAALPPGVPFVGGHPIAGTERSGVEAVVPGLFEGRTCVLTPDADTPAEAVAAVTALWHAVGAKVLTLGAAEHDRVLALVSHLPHAVAFSLAAAVAPELGVKGAALAGPSLASGTRVAASSAPVWRDICLENRGPLLHALDAFGERFAEFRGAVESGDEDALDDFFCRAAEARGLLWKP